jgi:hypothetical protein
MNGFGSYFLGRALLLALALAVYTVRYHDLKVFDLVFLLRGCLEIRTMLNVMK